MNTIELFEKLDKKYKQYYYESEFYFSYNQNKETLNIILHCYYFDNNIGYILSEENGLVIEYDKNLNEIYFENISQFKNQDYQIEFCNETKEYISNFFNRLLAE